MDEGGRLEGGDAEWQFQGTALKERDLVRQAAAQRQCLCHSNKFRCEVDPHHCAAIGCRKTARRPADARPDIEDMIATAQTQALGQRHRLRPPAQMELIDTGKVDRIEMGNILACFRQRRQDGRFQPVPAVMLRNQLLNRHVCHWPIKAS